MDKLNLLLLKNVRLDDSFWNKYTRLVTEQIIPYQWETLNDRVPDAATRPGQLSILFHMSLMRSWGKL